MKILQILGDWGQHKEILRIPDDMHYVLETINYREITEEQAKEIENEHNARPVVKRGCRFW